MFKSVPAPPKDKNKSAKEEKIIKKQRWGEH